MPKVTFNYCQTGFNAHKASTTFNFDSELGAKQFILSIWNQPGYSEITLNDNLVVDTEPFLAQNNPSH
jgi:hypothetical protein